MIRETTRRAAAPVAVAAARVRARPGRTLLVVAGVAGATAMLVAVLGGGLVARDRAVRASLAALPAGERSFRVDSFGLPPGQSYRSTDRRVRRVLAPLTPGEPVAGMFLRQLQIGGGLVQLVSLDRVAGLVRLRSGRLPRTCTAKRCEVLQLGGGGRHEWRQDGIHLVRVGVADLPDAAAFGSWLQTAPGPGGRRPTLLLAAGANPFDRIPLLDGFYRVYSWIDPVAPDAIHVWQIDRILTRESRAQTALERAGAELALSGPDAALVAARSSGDVSGRRLSLIGGEISALLLGFALVAALGLRRGLAAERWRLVQRGASRWQVLLGVGAEIGATTLAGVVLGLVAGAAALAVVARESGIGWGAVLGNGPGTAIGTLLVLLLWAVATALLVAVGIHRPEASNGRRLRVLDVVAVAAVVVVGVGFARGGIDAGSDPSGGDATFLLLLPGLVCLVAALAVARLLGPTMRLAERLARRGPAALRLATLALARAPARTAVTASFLAVAFGLALFATGYRATLEQGAHDQAAFAVPLDFTVTEGSRLVGPLAAAPLERFARIAPGVRAYPVVRQTAEVPGPGTSVLSPTVLGLTPGALAHLRWRDDFASAPIARLAARLAADPPATFRGIPLPAGESISVPAVARGAPVQLELAARDTSGETVRLQLRPRQGGMLVARTPAGQPLTLVGLEISVAETEGVGIAHRGAEGTLAAIPHGSIVLGPLRAGGRTLTTWRGWVAEGGTGVARGASDRARVSYAFSTGQTVNVRPRQTTDGKPLRVIASPGIAAAAGPDGDVVLDFGAGRVPARIVGVAQRFPGVGQQSDEFVVADESRLSVALDATQPGTGRAAELWVDAPREPATVAPALGRPPFSVLDVASRDALQRGLDGDPLARGVTLTLEAVALAAALFAVLALWLAVAGELGDERGELLDLEAQGVAPGTLRDEFRLRAAALVLVALVSGAILGAVLARLVVSLVGLTAGGATSDPPLRLEAAWPLDLAGAAAVAVSVAVVVELTIRRAFRGDAAGRPSWSLE